MIHPLPDDDLDEITPETVLYLSGPMLGYEHFNFPAFEEASQKLRAAGLNVISAHEVKHEDDGAAGSLPWKEYLRVDIREMMDKANAIILLPRWYQSRGAQLEAFIAHSLNWPVFFYREGAIQDREGRLVFPRD